MNTLPSINKQTKHIRSAALLNAAKNTINSVKDIPKGIHFSLSAPQSLSKNPLNMSLEPSKTLSLIPPETLSRPLPKVNSYTTEENAASRMKSPKLSLIIPPEYTSIPKIYKNKFSDSTNMIVPPFPHTESFSSTNSLPLPPIKPQNKLPKLGGTKRKRSLRKNQGKRRLSIKRKHGSKCRKRQYKKK